MIQPLLARLPPLAGRLLLSASMLELPLLLLLVHSLPELHCALPTCHHAEKNVSFTPKIHVTSSHREPQAFTITVKSLSFAVKYLQLSSDMCICLSRREHTANVRAWVASCSECSIIVLLVYRCRDMLEATNDAEYILTYVV